MMDNYTMKRSYRPPFSDTANQPMPMPMSAQAAPAKPRSPLKQVASAGHQKAPASPPLPRQNTKILPPSPPQVIRDEHRGLSFARLGFLGEGGFARVYEAEDSKGVRVAVKVVTKDSLKTKKAKTKLYAEIKIHRSLDHPNVVKFGDCFEDHQNVYMTLELCASGSLMDMLRRRRRFTEPEARYFSVQLLGACHYMHNRHVIHRDLKLGNLFLDGNMNVKVGDFGLAALIENPGERKKTICGTPNYIAPEVLFDTANGHSFEVDTWSIGVILYTLVIGRPPFQTKDVKAIYKRIRDNEYDFPRDREISTQARELIQEILTPDPQDRPTLLSILDHPFFTHGVVPAFIPTSAQDIVPNFRHITRAMSVNNFKRLKKNAMLDQPLSQSPGQLTIEDAQQQAILDVSKQNRSVVQQEREFQKAVQPGSPISALLGAARQPFLVAGANVKEREQPLIRKLQAVSVAKEKEKSGSQSHSVLSASSLSRTTAMSERNYLAEGGETRRKKVLEIVDEQAESEWDVHDARERGMDEDERERVARRKELEAQKARIVAQMVPSRPESAVGDNHEVMTKSHLGVPAMRSTSGMSATSAGGERYERARARAMTASGNRAAELRADEDEENVPPSRDVVSSAGNKELHSSTSVLTLHGFDAAAATLTAAFEARARGRRYRNSREDENLPEAKIFIVSWVDYCNKYGMGYALTDGSVGVHFNDSTSIVLSPNKHHFDYIAPKRAGAAYVRRNYSAATYPEELKSKVYLLKHFERYIMERLYGDYPYVFEDVGRARGMEWVQRYLRMKHVIVFRLSGDVLQFNFYDHTKVILSSHGLLVTHIDKEYQMRRWPLAELLDPHWLASQGQGGSTRMSSSSASPASGLTAEEQKAEEKLRAGLVEKLRYCKEVLMSIRNAAESVGAGGVGGDVGGEGGERI